MKKRFLPLVTFLIIPLLSGCTFNSNDDDKNFITKDIPFSNLSSDYIIKNTSIKTYYLENSEVPYIDLKDFFQKLSGYFDSEKINVQIREDLTAMYIYYMYNGSKYSKVTIDWQYNTITFTDFDIVGYYAKPSVTTSYSSHLRVADSRSSGISKVKIDLDDYGFDIYYHNGHCLLPYTVINSLFCSQNYYNVFYTSSNYYGYYGEMNVGEDAFNTIFNSSLKGLEQSQELREANYNTLCLIMDYFYGLKDDKGIANFDSYVSNELKEKLLSSNADDNLSAMEKIIHYNLNEIHSRMDTMSLYSTDTESFSINLSECGSFWQDYYLQKFESQDRRNSVFNPKETPVRYCGDTAVITFDSFVTAPNDVIYDVIGEVKSDAWKYDTYWFMDKVMSEISTHSEVNDILIDLSLNGGGNLGALYRCLGFLTNKSIAHYEYNTLTKEGIHLEYEVDTNHDDSFQDDDAYDQYRYTVLTSINTFSAANSFVCKAKQLDIVKTIGQTSGGGMCSVMPFVLLDGTMFTISSYNTTRYCIPNGDGTYNYSSIEKGFKPDLEIPYEDFYDMEKLVSYIDEVYQ